MIKNSVWEVLSIDVSAFNVSQLSNSKLKSINKAATCRSSIHVFVLLGHHIETFCITSKVLVAQSKLLKINVRCNAKFLSVKLPPRGAEKKLKKTSSTFPIWFNSIFSRVKCLPSRFVRSYLLCCFSFSSFALLCVIIYLFLEQSIYASALHKAKTAECIEIRNINVGKKLSRNNSFL